MSVDECGLQNRFGEDIYMLIYGGNKDWHKFSLGMEVLNVMHPNLNVFGLMIIH